MSEQDRKPQPDAGPPGSLGNPFPGGPMNPYPPQPAAEPVKKEDVEENRESEEDVQSGI